MALSLQDGIYVWQKVSKALAGANPGVSQPFRELKTYIATQLGNPQLQFIPYTAAQVVVNTGFQAADAASTLYAMYAKGRRTTGTTAAFLSVHAATTNGATTTTVVTTRFLATGQVFAAIYPAGVAVETALTISAATTVGGPTESSEADAADGFVIVGA